MASGRLTGWEFRAGDFSVRVAEPNNEEARKIAKTKLPNLPEGQPKFVPHSVVRLLNLKRGESQAARVNQRTM